MCYHDEEYSGPTHEHKTEYDANDFFGYMQNDECDEDLTYIVHRGAGLHETNNEDCWCEPLLLDYEDINLLTYDELNAMLRDHYRTQ